MIGGEQLVGGAVDHERRDPDRAQPGVRVVGLDRDPLIHEHRQRRRKVLRGGRERRVVRGLRRVGARDDELEAGAQHPLEVARQDGGGEALDDRLRRRAWTACRRTRCSRASACGPAAAQASASSWATIPPIEIPSTCERSMSSASSSASASRARPGDRQVARRRPAAPDAAMVVQHELEVALEGLQKRLAPVQAVGADALDEQQRGPVPATLVVQFGRAHGHTRHAPNASGLARRGSRIGGGRHAMFTRSAPASG